MTNPKPTAEMKEKIENVITFIEAFVIECPLTAGCGRCNEARRYVAALKGVIKALDTEVDRVIEERMPVKSICRRKSLSLSNEKIKYGWSLPHTILKYDEWFRNRIKGKQ